MENEFKHNTTCVDFDSAIPEFTDSFVKEYNMFLGFVKKRADQVNEFNQFLLKETMMKK